MLDMRMLGARGRLSVAVAGVATALLVAVRPRYFGPFHPSRQDRWAFGDCNSGAYLHRFF
ncbi:MAG: hypothetical protein ACRDSZ_13760 [Pseudonocardiaceae bacterium]